MKKSLISLAVLVFALGFGLAQAADAPAKADPLAAACKGKKAGAEVTVDGKKTTCPKKEITKKKTSESAPAGK